VHQFSDDIQSIEQSGSFQEELNVDEPSGNKRKTNSTHNIVDVRVVPTGSIFFVLFYPFGYMEGTTTNLFFSFIADFRLYKPKQKGKKCRG
jgi:hypothetical protein